MHCFPKQNELSLRPQLCEAGADVSVTDLAGQTPAALAGRNNVAKQADAVALLRKYAQAS